MKLLLPCIILSFVLHLLLCLVFSNIWVREPERELVIDFQSFPASVEAELVSIQPEEIIEPVSPLGLDYNRPVQYVNLAEYKATLELLDSTDVITDSLQHITHEDLFIVDTVYLARPDYSKLPLTEYLKGNMAYQPGSNRPDGGVQNYNNVQDQIFRQSSGNPQQSVGVLGLVHEGVKELGKLLGVTDEPGPVRMDFVPEEKELQALNVIWQNKQATDVMIYASFDTCLKVTAEDLRKVLDGLEEKGLLKKEIVSPRNEFTFFGLTGESGLEMSKTNLRNRIYEYTPLISKEEMRDYLNAILYQQQMKQKETTTGDEKDQPVLPDIQSLLDIIFKDNEIE